MSSPGGLNSDGSFRKRFRNLNTFQASCTTPALHGIERWRFLPLGLNINQRTRGSLRMYLVGSGDSGSRWFRFLINTRNGWAIHAATYAYVGDSILTVYRVKTEMDMQEKWLASGSPIRPTVPCWVPNLWSIPRLQAISLIRRWPQIPAGRLIVAWSTFAALTSGMNLAAQAPGCGPSAPSRLRYSVLRHIFIKLF